MSNLTIRQAVQGMLKLQDSGDHATMVGIGPMSPNPVSYTHLTLPTKA